MALFKYDSVNDKLVPLTSEGNIGIPVGAVQGFALGTQSPNWLLCDGRDTTGTVEELQTHYPALYTYLGNSNVLPEKYETSKDTRVFMTVNDPQASLSGNIQIENASHVTSIEMAGATRANQHNLARLAVDLTTATSLLFGFGGSDYTITINGTYDSANDTWTTTSFTGGSTRGLFINYDELGATETRRYLYIKATSAGIEVDKDLYATKGYIRDQNILSNYESITWTNSAAGAFEMQYDGIFCSGNGSAEGVNFMVSSDGGTSWTRVAGCGGGGEPGTWQSSGAQILLQKGWKVYAVLNNLSAEGGLPTVGSVAYYKLRDYTGR